MWLKKGNVLISQNEVIILYCFLEIIGYFPLTTEWLPQCAYLQHTWISEHLVSNIYLMTNYLIFWISTNQDVRWFLPIVWNCPGSIQSVSQCCAWLGTLWYTTPRQKLALKKQRILYTHIFNLAVSFSEWSVFLFKVVSPHWVDSFR